MAAVELVGKFPWLHMTFVTGPRLQSPSFASLFEIDKRRVGGNIIRGELTAVGHSDELRGLTEYSRVSMGFEL